MVSDSCPQLPLWSGVYKAKPMWNLNTQTLSYMYMQLCIVLYSICNSFSVLAASVESVDSKPEFFLVALGSATIFLLNDVWIPTQFKVWNWYIGSAPQNQSFNATHLVISGNANFSYRLSLLVTWPLNLKQWFLESTAGYYHVADEINNGGDTQIFDHLGRLRLIVYFKLMHRSFQVSDHDFFLIGSRSYIYTKWHNYLLLNWRTIITNNPPMIYSCIIEAS